MLLSQKIAKDVNYINPTHFRSTREVFDARLAIMSAVKFVVPNELLNVSIQSMADVAMGKQDKEHISTLLSNLDNESRTSLYEQFAIPPFDTIFIESDKTGVLIINSPDTDSITYHLFTVGYGQKKEYAVFSDCEYEYKRKEAVASYSRSVKPTAREGLDEAMAEKINEAIDSLIMGTVLEILLLLNAKNTNVATYTPTKKEISYVPKNAVKSYVYHILDLYREGTKYESVKDVTEFVGGTGRHSSEKRAHFVRGHFKRKKNGLFWWSPFMRCRKNSEVGVVDKDYRIKV